jgi:hypothetical protein
VLGFEEKRRCFVDTTPRVSTGGRIGDEARDKAVHALKQTHHPLLALGASPTLD